MCLKLWPQIIYTVDKVDFTVSWAHVYSSKKYVKNEGHENFVIIKLDLELSF